MQHHLASSKRAGLTPEDWKALKNYDFANFSDSEKTALIYAEKLTREPWEVTDDDIAGLKQFFSEPQIVDLHLVVGEINLTNRFTDPLGLELEFEPEKI
jgi:alkylhydroperoxidase family enzyme